MILGRLRSQVREDGRSIFSIEPILVVFISESVIPERKVNIATGERAMFGLVAAAHEFDNPVCYVFAELELSDCQNQMFSLYPMIFY